MPLWQAHYHGSYWHTFTDVHCKMERLQNGKVVPGYFPGAAPTGPTTLLGMMIRVIERPHP